MKKLEVLPVGAVELRLLQWLADALGERFRIATEILTPRLDVTFALHAERQQYHSSEILARMQRHVGNASWRVLGVTSLDLYIPILTFVFGEAQMGGPSALVSYHRLRQEFYGLPEDADLVANRLLVESVHELGHTLHLTHCTDYRCAMAPAHAVEWIDIKEGAFCGGCRARALQVV